MDRCRSIEFCGQERALPEDTDFVHMPETQSTFKQHYICTEFVLEIIGT